MCCAAIRNEEEGNKNIVEKNKVDFFIFFFFFFIFIIAIFFFLFLTRAVDRSGASVARRRLLIGRRRANGDRPMATGANPMVRTRCRSGCADGRTKKTDGP